MKALLDAAVDKGITAEALEKLVTLHERVADRNARMAYNDAKKRFQATVPDIPETSEVKYGTGRGATRFTYAKLNVITRTIQPTLDACELSYTWDEVLSQDGKTVTETCTLSHVDGHSESSTAACPTETKNASMSAQHRVAGAGKTAMRQSLIRVLGLVTLDQEIGEGSGEKDHELIGANQVADLEDLIKVKGGDDAPAWKARLLKYMGVAHLEDIPQGSYAEAVNALNRKGKQR